ncbi:hypothetical protein EC988_004955, partial [Linderina pennispora]
MSSDERPSGELQKDLLMRLPFDLSVLVSKFLDIEDIYSCMLVSRSWYKLVSDHAVLYQRLLQRSHFDQEPLLFRGPRTGNQQNHE